MGLRAGGNAYVCVLFEHKSYVDPLVALQVLRYMVRVWDYSILFNIRNMHWATWRQFCAMLRLPPREFVLRMCGWRSNKQHQAGVH